MADILANSKMKSAIAKLPCLANQLPILKGEKMALFVLGEVLTCKGKDVPYNDKKTGAAKLFRSHKCLILNRQIENPEPIAVETGECYLEPGKCYRIQVYARLYQPDGGRPIIQYNTFKDDIPVEYNPHPATK